MRTITTVTTRSLATGIVRAAEGTNPNLAPPKDLVATVKDRLDKLIKLLDYPADLSTHQAAIVQERYLDRLAAGVYDREPSPVTL